MLTSIINIILDANGDYVPYCLNIRNYYRNQQMNIIYKLTNKSKTDFPNTYIGSKKNCRLEEIDSVPTIVYLSNGKPYYSSSTLYRRINKTEDELVKHVMDSIASGKTSTDVCNELGSTSLIVNLYKKYNIEIGQETATFIRNGNRINEVLSEES